MDNNLLVDAAFEGNIHRVRELLDAGEIECYGNEEYDAEQCSLCDALEDASANGHLEIAEPPSRYGADVNWRHDYRSLARAASEGHANIVKLLSEHMDDSDGNDSDGGEPLRWAILNDHWDVVEVLLDFGATGVMAANLYDELVEHYGEDFNIRINPRRLRIIA